MLTVLFKNHGLAMSVLRVVLELHKLGSRVTSILAANMLGPIPLIPTPCIPLAVVFFWLRARALGLGFSVFRLWSLGVGA